MPTGTCVLNKFEGYVTNSPPIFRIPLKDVRARLFENLEVVIPPVQIYDTEMQ
jgi:hypothetical protein